MLGYRPICVKNNTCVNRKRYESDCQQTLFVAGVRLLARHFFAETDTFWPAEDFRQAPVVIEP